jgi:hypothetical protein
LPHPKGSGFMVRLPGIGVTQSGNLNILWREMDELQVQIDPSQPEETSVAEGGDGENHVINTALVACQEI